MSDQTNGSGSSSSNSGADSQRSQLATTLVRHSLAIIWGLIGGLVLLAVVQGFNTSLAAEYRQALDKILTAVLPLLGAWIGAIIAFYFGRENYDAAVRNVREIIRVQTPDKLESIFVKDVMVPAAKLVTAATPSEDAKPLQAGILPRLEERGLGRLIVVTGGTATTDNAPPASAVAKGVVHDSVINRFIATRLAAGAATGQVTLGALLADAEVARLLSSAVVYVTPDATLADVRRKMDEASKSASASVRDVLVTAGGKAGEPLLGYLTDIDLADKGTFK
jgi:CBS domain-containing protein